MNHLTATTIESRSASGEIRLAYQFAPELPKPTIHPLVTPAGIVLTAYEPSDHLWHRGVWFTIKLINGSNFWEENAPYGIQRTLIAPAVTIDEPGVTRIQHRLQWTSEATGPVLEELRDLQFKLRDDGSTVIDWCSQLTPRADLLLDRTPYSTWGGYSGFTFRGSNDLHDVHYLLPNGMVAKKITGDRYSHVVMQAKAFGTKPVSIAMIDHPDNPRSPSPWYCRSDPNYAFANAAFLFHEPMNVRANQILRFRYRLVCRDGLFERSYVEDLARSIATGVD